MTIIYFILVLSTVIFIHELGHFIFAKKAGIYVYEFCIGMGPQIFKFKRKNDETIYALRILPIGGFCSLAGESNEEDPNIPKNSRLQDKTWFQKFMTVIGGVLFNFIFAIIIFFIIGLVNGKPENKPTIVDIQEWSSIYGLVDEGSVITKIDGVSVSNVDRFLLEYQIRLGQEITITTDEGDFKIVHQMNENDQPVYGFGLSNEVEYGFLEAIEYGFTKFANLVEQMALIVVYLFTGDLELSSLSGPVGIFDVVGQSAKAGFMTVIFLVAYLSINVGFINLLPIPAFDGGRLVFLLIELITRKPVSPKIENIIHFVGFILLMILMVVITYNDIVRFFF